MVVNGFKCLKCFTNIFVEYYTFRQYNGRVPTADSDSIKRTDMCNCGNCGLILDLDGLVHLYCDDISTVLLCRVDTENPSDAEILQSSKGFYYQDYYSISSTSHNFEALKEPVQKVQRNLIQRTYRRKDKHGKESQTRNKNRRKR